MIRRPGASPRARRGLTLIELLLVMGLIAVLLGVGVGLMAGIDTAERVAVGTVRSALRAARNSAVASNGSAEVRFERGPDVLVAEGLEVVGTWRFESILWPGAFGLDGVPVNGDPDCVEDGYLGRCVSFRGAERGTHLAFDVREEPRFHLEHGFSIEVQINLDSLGGAPLLAVGKAAGIDLKEDGGLVGWFRRSSDDPDVTTVRGTRIPLETPAGVIEPGRWQHLRLDYDGALMRLAVEGVEVARFAVEGDVIDIDGPLTVGSGPGAGALEVLDGRVDDLVVRAVTETAVVTLPDGATFGAPLPGVLRYVATGALDPAVHREPVVVPLTFADGAVRDVVVGLFGTVE